jgi:hypothetical protein
LNKIKLKLADFVAERKAGVLFGLPAFFYASRRECKD